VSVLSLLELANLCLVPRYLVIRRDTRMYLYIVYNLLNLSSIHKMSEKIYCGIIKYVYCLLNEWMLEFTKYWSKIHGKCKILSVVYLWNDWIKYSNLGSALPMFWGYLIFSTSFTKNMNIFWTKCDKFLH